LLQSLGFPDLKSFNVQTTIGGQFYDLLKHMYSNTLYCCKSEGYISEPFQANLGVKQGDSLRPITPRYLYSVHDSSWFGLK
jgi:hypothetical protein